MDLNRMLFSILIIFYLGCTNVNPSAVKPVVVTQKVKYDTDDPAIWYNSSDPKNSIVFGTDKEIGGGIVAFDLKGNIIENKCITGLQYPNNIDIEYGLKLSDSSFIDIAVTCERPLGKIRIYQVPEMKEIDHGGLPVFEGEQNPDFRLPMGIALYKNPVSKTIDLIVSRKAGPTDGSYLWQYRILVDSTNVVSLDLIRKFGNFSGGLSEIEAIMVDDQLGYVYYSDESAGIRKYYANPDKGNEELAFFGIEEFKEDREGIALWPINESDGYIFISNQQENSFNVYPRNPPDHNHVLITIIPFSVNESDGSEILYKPLDTTFTTGIMVSMSDNRTFHYYNLEDLFDRIKE